MKIANTSKDIFIVFVSGVRAANMNVNPTVERNRALPTVSVNGRKIGNTDITEKRSEISTENKIALAQRTVLVKRCPIKPCSITNRWMATRISCGVGKTAWPLNDQITTVPTAHITINNKVVLYGTDLLGVIKLVNVFIIVNI